ncbi:MAG: CHAT domain-containing protein [Anaerolineales bacterium]|nr:MAG: CHAT domain-containing protein [Anaerolineales bacterium]
MNSELSHVLDSLKDQPRLQITVLGGDHALSPEIITRLQASSHEIQGGTASLDNIMRALSNGEQYHILHILAHGRYNKLNSESDLYLQDNNGLTKTVRDSDITLRLGALANLPHLVFLAACESARRDAGDQNAFVGLASKLVACGVPAVVAMQDMVPIDAAQKLTADFYAYLMLHGVVDRALAQARLLLFDPNSKTWATPVLTMRLKDGLLFDLED